MTKKNLNCKQYTIKKKLCESLIKEQKYYEKEILKAEKKLQKQKAQNKKYQSLAEYEWLRNNKYLYNEQLQLENSISGTISYYKSRLEKLPEEISYEKSEMKRLKKIILSENPSYDFTAPIQPEKRNYKKELEFRIEKLNEYKDILEEKLQQLGSLKLKLDKIQSMAKKSNKDKENERECIVAISNIQLSIGKLDRAIIGCKISIADIAVDAFSPQNKKK